MRHLFYNILLIAGILLGFACGAEDDPAAAGGNGYLRLSVGQSNELNTKAGETEEYKYDRIAVYIKNSEGKTVKQTTDFDGEWKGKQIELPAGEYTIEAESYGWDGEAGEDKACYKGSQKVTIESGKPATADVKCYLANVKVTVAFEQAFLNALGTGKIAVQIQNVNDETHAYQAVDFAGQAEKKVCYFAATDLDIKYTVTNAEGKTNSLTRELCDVKPKTHYLVTFKLQQQGQSDFTVTVDGTMTEYSCTITVNPNDASAALLTANPWAKFAYLKAESVNAGGADISSLKFQYRKKDTETWTDAAATEETDAESNKYYTGKTGALEASTQYEYRLASADGKSFTTPAAEFTTDVATVLPNASFDDWYQSGKTWYMGVSSNPFWDSSNPGTTQGLGALVGVNPTEGVETPVHTPGGKAARLHTQWAVMKLAAASLYAGQFNTLVGTDGAKIDFGRPFTARPTALQGWFQYAPQLIDNDSQEVGKYTPSMKGQKDVCSIYIALATEVCQVDNTDSEKITIDFENDSRIIAYGELPIEECVDTNGEWKEFNIPLKYKSLTDKPSHIIVVCSSSKYGDYFTGAVGSVLYLDDFSLVYDGEPEIWVKE